MIRNIFKRFYNRNITPFPEIKDVFLEPLDELDKVFFPVCTIRLGDIKKEWEDEKIHLIQFNEDPYNDDTKQYFNDYCKDNMIAFDLVNSKYRFKTDIKYFQVSPKWEKCLNDTARTYQQSKEKFLQNQEDSGIGLLSLGGEPEWWQHDNTPIDPDGNPMEFITEFETGTICDDWCSKKIYLFYSHKFKMAVQVYQIT